MSQNSMLCLVSTVCLFVVSIPGFTAVSGEAIARQGNGKGVPACQSCHGDKGQGNALAGYPYLAGQPAAYLSKQLLDFAGKRRKNAIMQAFANALTAEEIKAVSGYYAGLSAVAVSASEKKDTDKTLLSRGAYLVKNGKWSVGMPGCFQCHGDKGQGIAPIFPAISGLPESYIKTQLEDWRKGERHNDPVGLMQAVVANLEESEIAAIARYLALQPR